MARPLSILIIEAANEDSRLIKDLQREGFEARWTTASTKREFLQCLGGEFDIILARDDVPDFDVRLALDHLKTSGVDLPLIVVSASQPDSKTAEDWLTRGAHNYVTRRDRLGHALRSALRERDLAEDHARDLQELRTRERQQAVLAELGRRALSPAEDLSRLFREAVAVVARTLDVEFAKILELTPEGDRLLLREGVGWNPGLVGRATVSAGAESQAGYTLMAHGPVVVDDLRTEARFNGPEVLFEHGIISGLSAPIEGKEGPFGVLGAHTASHRSFSAEDALFLQGVANVLGAAVQRQAGEQALQASERRFRALVEQGWDAVALSDAAGVCLYTSPATSRITGYRPEGLVGRNGFAFVHPDDMPRVTAHFDRVIAAKRPVRPLEFRIQHKDGSWRWVEGVSTNLLDDPAVRGVVFNFRDVTERKEVEAALRASDETYRAVVENLAEGITISVGGIRVFVNDAFVRIHGLKSRNEAVGRPVDHFVVAEEKERVRNNALARERGESPSDRYLYHIQRADGEIRSLETRAARITYRGQPAVLAVLEDVTEREQATEALRVREEELRQAQKMEALGLLAGGVAHDFNNLLTTIIGHGELALRQLPDSAPQAHVTEITKAAEHAAALTRQLLAVSRRQVLQPEVLDLNRLLEGMESLLRRVIGEDVELVAVHDPDLAPVRVDRSQMEQVIMNLAVNARDAMPNGGRLMISTANVRGLAAGRGRGPPADPQVMLLVGDTGKGMDTHTLSHAFEPFFTTKEPGRGSGLGLAIVYGIVSQSGGTIQVISAPGQGATFRILLPCADGEREPVPGLGASPEIGRGRETVLLVEDDPRVRGVARLALEELGYNVLEGASGLEAVARAGDYPGPIDLLVTDVVMPGMGGPEAARAIRAKRPETRVLFISGYVGEGGSLGVTLAPDATFLAKPFTPDQLGRKVRDVLDAPSSLPPYP